MSRLPICLIATAILTVPAAIRAGAPGAPDEGVSAWRTDLVQWRQKYAEGLNRPDGWLSLTGLAWLQEGSNTFGSAADNHIVVPGQAPARFGTLKLEKGAVHLFSPKDGFPKGLLVNGGAPQSGQRLFDDDSQQPSSMTTGGIVILVLHRGNRHALRIKDADAPTRLNFHGLHWYDADPAYRVRARWIPYNPPQHLSVATIIGTTDDMVVPGAVEFQLNGQTLRLKPVLENPDDKDLFFILRDTTSKTETYGAGRFLYTDLPSNGLQKTGEVWLDFNRLENPPCAYTPYATCPLPPRDNRLTVALPVGERRYHD